MQIRVQVTRHQDAGCYRLLEMSAPQIADEARPGQFVHVHCRESFDPLLRRPFSFYDIDPEAGKIKILYEIVGSGTRFLSQLHPGDYLDVLGPLGNGFALGTLGPGTRVILVGGGVGGAPMAALARRLVGAGVSDIQVLLGASTSNRVIPTDVFDGLGIPTEVATEDGSRGERNLVTALLPRAIGDMKENHVFACGPEEMLKAIATICADLHIPCQLSMDAVLACGVGACQGCVRRFFRDGKQVFLKVCDEGPVFQGREVVWDE